MRTEHHNLGGPCGVRRLILLPALIALALLLLAAAGCASAGGGASAATRAATFKQIAVAYASDGDLARAKAAMDKLDLANPTQLLVTQAEEEIGQGAPADEIVALARLAGDLGARSPKLMAYLEPTAAPTAAAPTATPVPPTPVVVSTATPLPATATPTEPATLEPTWTPPAPHVVADEDINLRSGPGKAYPIMAKLHTGEEANIIARNASGDWWQLAWDGQVQAWVAGTVVQVKGPIDTVKVAQNIPTPPPPPPTSTTAPPPPPTAPPKPAVDYVVKSLRLRPVGQDAQRCDGGDHNIFVTVIDPAGNPLDGVRVREVFSGVIRVTGDQGKGPGRAEYDIYRGGGGQVDIIDEAGNRISELSRGMSDDWPPIDLMWDAGYCNCKPYPDPESCAAGLKGKEYTYFATGHYVFEVVFQRTY